MAIQILAPSFDGLVQVNNDGSVTFIKNDLSKTEVLPSVQTKRRWPELAVQIDQALAKSSGARSNEDMT